MLAARFAGSGRFELVDVPKPTIDRAREVIVKVEAAGVCGSDMHYFHRPNWLVGLITGHEPAGVVAEVGPGVTNVQVGDRVSVHAVVGCGQCEFCHQGLNTRCHLAGTGRGVLGFDLDGGFAEFVRVPDASAVFPIPDSISFDEAALLTDSLGTPAKGIRLSCGDDVKAAIVFGLGTIGLNAVQILRSRGLRVIGVDTLAHRLDLAHRLTGCETLAAAGDDTPDRARDMTDGGADLVIDATGSHEGRRAAIESAGWRGRVHCVGIALGETPVDFLWSVMYPERTLTGSWWSEYAEFDDVVKLVTGGQVDLKSVITHTFSLNEIAEAFAVFTDRAYTHSVKVMIHP